MNPSDLDTVWIEKRKTYHFFSRVNDEFTNERKIAIYSGLTEGVTKMLMKNLTNKVRVRYPPAHEPAWELERDMCYSFIICMRVFILQYMKKYQQNLS